MTNKPKRIGTAAETAIVKYVRANGFDGAERIALHGTDDQGDVSLCPGVMVESKAGKTAESASDALIAQWLDDTELERVARGCDVAALITKRRGKGAANAGQWFAWLPGWAYVCLATGADAHDACAEAWLYQAPTVRILLSELCTLLRRAGYGTPLEGIAA